MGDPEESTNRIGTKTVGQDASWNNTSDRQTGTSSNNQSNSLSDQVQLEGNIINNGKLTTTNTSNKDINGEINNFGVVLALRYKKVDLKESFDVFCEKLIN